jgi:hypothetical protein
MLTAARQDVSIQILQALVAEGVKAWVMTALKEQHNNG